MSLSLSRFIYREIGAMVQENEAANAPSYFWTWLARVYFHDASVGVRRLMDRDRRVVSMLKLLNEIRDHPEVMSRRRILHLHTGRPRAEREQAAARVIRPGRAIMDTANIARLRRELLDAHARLRRYVNTHVVHRQRNPMRRPPTFRELHAAIDVLGRALEECAFLLEAATFDTLVPALPWAWEAAVPSRLASRLRRSACPRSVRELAPTTPKAPLRLGALRIRVSAGLIGDVGWRGGPNHLRSLTLYPTELRAREVR
jgi:AbiU2